MSVTDSSGVTVRMQNNVRLFDWIESELESIRIDPRDCEGLPFAFRGGFVGSLGYELRSECGALPNKYAIGEEGSAEGDAHFFMADRFLAIDHVEDTIHLVELKPCSSAVPSTALTWFDEAEKRIRESVKCVSETTAKAHRSLIDSNGALAKGFALRRDTDTYRDSIASALEYIRNGDTYEVCLTNALIRSNSNSADAFKPRQPELLYSALRRTNPAPYAAYLNFGDDSNAICCSSPERFLRLSGDGVLEAKPIKGTARRAFPHGCDEDIRLAKELENSAKDRMENMMIGVCVCV